MRQIKTEISLSAKIDIETEFLACILMDKADELHRIALSRKYELEHAEWVAIGTSALHMRSAALKLVGVKTQEEFDAMCDFID